MQYKVGIAIVIIVFTTLLPILFWEKTRRTASFVGISYLLFIYLYQDFVLGKIVASHDTYWGYTYFYSLASLPLIQITHMRGVNMKFKVRFPSGLLVWAELNDQNPRKGSIVKVTRMFPLETPYYERDRRNLENIPFVVESANNGVIVLRELNS